MNRPENGILCLKRQKQYLVLLMSLSAIIEFTIFPYLTLYLKTQLKLSNEAAGLTVGSIALIAACGAWLGGWLVDRLGWLPMLRLSSLFYGLVFLGLSITMRSGTVIGLIITLGLCRLLMEPALKTALVIHDDENGRLFKLRYMALVGGAIIGPLLSATLSAYGDQSGFTVAAFLFAIYLAMTGLLKKHEASTTKNKTLPLSVNWRAICLFITLGFIFFLVFSQFETTLSLRLSHVFGADGPSIYRKALLINAVLAIPMLQFTDRMLVFIPLNVQIALGVLLMSLSVWLLFGASHVNWCIYLGAGFFTFGEVILFPLPEIAMAKLVTKENRGQLMGLVDLRYLGFFFGPAMGSLLINNPRPVLALTLCALSLTIFPLYLSSTKNKNLQTLIEG